jgi:hypothetical protein
MDRGRRSGLRNQMADRDSANVWLHVLLIQVCAAVMPFGCPRRHSDAEDGKDRHDRHATDPAGKSEPEQLELFAP